MSQDPYDHEEGDDEGDSLGDVEVESQPSEALPVVNGRVIGFGNLSYDSLKFQATL